MKRKLCLRLFLLLLLCSTAFVGVYGEEPQSGKITASDIIYFVMTDRFENGDPGNDYGANPKDIRDYNGGDLQGVIDKLDYIKSLGATTVWITPVAENSSGGYHGYWATGFYKVDKHLGDVNKLKELVDKAHEKGMKIILDLVVNHTSVVHPWVSDDHYADWFHDTSTISNWNDQQEVENGKLAGLPDLAQENPEVAKYLIDMAKWWIDETGIDGFRLDTVRHVPKEFWLQFTEEIKKEYPDFYMIGEVWDGRQDYVGGYQQTGFSGMIDFPMYFAIKDVFASSKSVDLIKTAIEKSDVYQNRSLYGTFIDNHDVSRFISMAGSNKEQKLQQALMFEMTYTGIPVIYYGTEIAMEGSEDPTNRKFMEWEKESPVTDYIKKLIAIRKENEAFTKGNIQVTAAKDYFLAYERVSENSGALVVFNTANKANEQQLTISQELLNKGSWLVNAMNPKDVLSLKDASISISLAPKESKIYIVQKKNASILFMWVIPLFLIALYVYHWKRHKNK